MSFKIGDKVQCIRDYQSGSWKSITGIVIAFNYGKGLLGVNFKRKSRTGRGHDLSGSIKTETGWWFPIKSAEHYLKETGKQFEFEF